MANHLKNQSNNYKHSIPDLELSIERNTSQVPADGKFHVIYKGNIIASYSSRRKAEETFHQIVKESGYKPEPISEKSSEPNVNERYLLSKDLFWAEGPKYRSKGGRGR